METKCCERPKLSDLRLKTEDPTVFYRTQWIRFPCYVFIAYRVIIALYMLGILIAYLIQQIQVFSGQAFVYLTNLGFIIFVIYLAVAGVIAVVDGGILIRDRNSQDPVMGIRHKVHWALFSVTVNTNILVTVIYWGALYNSNFPFFYDFHVHTLTTIISMVDLYLTAIPVRYLHVVYPVCFDIAYLTMTVVFWAAGGRTISTNGAIYPFLDYSNSPGLAAGVIVGVFAAIFLTQGIIWGLYKLRVWIWLKCGNDEVTQGPGGQGDQEMDKIEEGM